MADNFDSDTPWRHQDMASSTGALSASSAHSKSSASSSKPGSSSRIATAYRQAAQLFLTRRLPEALSTIKPIITPFSKLNASSLAPTSAYSPDYTSPVALVAKASRGTRIKVWSFYLTFLNAVVELGPEDGKDAFGVTEWKALVAKTRDGSVWEEIVRDGYGGREENVDPEVVINISTLLLTHSPSQELNQHRLESYLATTSDPFRNFPSDISVNSPRPRQSTHSFGGASTPRDINTRLRLIELYTLHVLPRNNRWQEARDFISSCDLLYDDRRDAFMTALDTLREEVDQTRRLEEELVQKQAREMEEARRAEQERSERLQRELAAKKKKTDELTAQTRALQAHTRKHPPALSSASTASAPPAHHTRRQTSSSTGVEPSPHRTHSSKSISSSSASSLRPRGRQSSATSTSSVSHMISHLSTSAQKLLQSTTRSLTGAGPLGMVRYAILLLLLVFSFGNRQMRDRIRRSILLAWSKLTQTIGMGAKVSYV